MSRYAQPQPYGHVTYPGYPQPALHGYQYQLQPPPPSLSVYHVDPNVLRRDYAARLTELTINSRPIIQSLSMYAQEYSRWAEIIAQCIEAHIRRVPAWMKLPAFYLLDAISKNVFEPYARHFATLVVQLFIDTYEQVDQATRSKMEEMLLTWRTGSPTGKELFGIVPQAAIERGVWGGGTSTHASDSLPGNGQINKSMVITELEFTLGQKERALAANPYDTTSQNHITVLQQLRKLVDAGVSQEELGQILGQLRTLTQSASPPPPPPAPSQTFPPHAYPSQAQYTSHTSPPFAPSTATPAAYSQPNYQFRPPDHPSVETPALGPAFTPATNTSPPNPSVPTASAIDDLFNTLLQAGIVSTNMPIGAGATATTSAAPIAVEGDKATNVDLLKESRASYRKLILSQKIKLTTADLTKTQPDIVNLLYTQLPSKCKQCGIRFSNNSLGNKKLEAHLDMHFRQNRKASQNIGRGHSRSWFIELEDWISDSSGVDVGGKDSVGRLRRPLNAKAAAAAEVAKREAELSAQYVVVPPGDEAKPHSCPICKEPMIPEFLEEDEDWVWKNAVRKDDKIYHATCHAEAVTSTTSLAARLRNEICGRSRSQTPEARGSRSPPPVARSPLPPKVVGAKRKAEDEPTPSVKVEPDRSPPPAKKSIKSPPSES